MKETLLTKVNAYRYIDAVRDDNEVHRSDVVACKYGLPEAVVPGMWLASHIQGRTNISGIKQIKFSDGVFYGETISINEFSNMIGKGKDYEFKRGDDVVCEIRGVDVGEYCDSCKDLNKTIYIYEADVCPERINLFLSSLGYQSGFVDLPEMYLVSLSAPALLGLGKNLGMTGAHASQSFNMHSSYNFGEIKVVVGDEKVKGPLHYFELRWMQGNKIIASGRASVFPFVNKLERKVIKEVNL